MNPKEYRQIIYKYIEENIGVFDVSIKSGLSSHLRELCKIHNEVILSLMKKSEDTLKQMRDARDKARAEKRAPKITAYNKIIKKNNKTTIKTTETPFFNNDFLKR